MDQLVNKNAICTVLFMDIAGYSGMLVSEQIAFKEQFNRIISEAVADVAPNDRIMLDTGDGAAIAFLGAPEDCLFIAIRIRDAIVAPGAGMSHPLVVRFGINLGPVRVLRDLNGQLNIIGDGINTAQRVMSFADPNQILVSRAYYEVVSRLTTEITALFAYAGVRMDKYVREHEVYEVAGIHRAAHEGSVSTGKGGMASVIPAARWPRWLLIVGGATAGLVLLSVSFYISVKDDTPNVPEMTHTVADERGVEEKAPATASERAKQPISSWQKLLDKVKTTGEKTPNCSDAQRMLKQCE